MKNSETGEYEVVVGNGQLLSAFFIVVLLMGFAFFMGYMIGRNGQQPKAQSDAASNAQAQTAAQPAATAAAPAQPSADQVVSQPAASDTPAAAPETAAPQPTTQPAREAALAPVSTPAAAAPAPAPTADEPTGSFWQVAAFKSADEAQPIVRTLQNGGMPVVVKTYPDHLAHVLVGPFRDTRALNQARQELTGRFGIKTVYPRQLPIK